MNPLDINKHDLRKAIIDELNKIIDKCNVIDSETKSKIQNYIQDNLYSFDVYENKHAFLKSAFEYGALVYAVKQQEHKELWEKVVVQNAAINNFPHIVADAAIKQLEANFQNHLYPSLISGTTWARDNGYIKMIGANYYSNDNFKTILSEANIMQLYYNQQKNDSTKP
jgi:hypothetical protein